MMRIGLLTTLWKRHELENITMRWHASIDIPGIEIVPVAVGSEGAVTRRLAERAGWLYIEAPNEPLSDKHNAGLRAFASAGVDAVCVMGSDDLLNAAYFEHVAGQVAQGVEVIEFRGLWFYDAPRDALTYADAWSTGVGRCLSSSLLKRIGWKGWEDGKATHLDHSMRHQAVVKGRPRSWVGDLRRTDIRIVDIKSEVSLWSYDWCMDITLPKRRHPHPDPRDWFDRHFPGTYDALHTTATVNPTNTTA